MSRTAVLWHDSANPLVAQLHYHARGVQKIRLLVPVVLEPESPSYARWRDLVLLTLRRYALEDRLLVLVLLDCSRHYSAMSDRSTIVVTPWSSPSRAERGWAGLWRPPSPRRGTWCRSWGQHDADTTTKSTLALLTQPVVRAHLHVSVPGSRW